ncbi:putative olfactory receptor 2W6 [Bufo bufo]|uniref:putative olfactory receptor 2W6 n=1 Tax=Bufo bufo TaxID=8384 RepID=UPI001ABE0F9E|nr:putative olfactory receptor 2W6 [Bufo bufo]
MELFNQSSSRFILLGFSTVPYLEVIGFITFLLMYLITLLANLLLIIVVRFNLKLHTPMYFFLVNLSFIDICFSTTVVPKLLYNTLAKDRSVSRLECAVQMHFHLALGSAECFILAVMAYDRFAAICKPLHYNTIMSRKICINLAAVSWTSSFISSISQVTYTFQMSFCHTRHVNHFFCELPALLKISCSDTWIHELINYIMASIIVNLFFLLILISYIHILVSILKISSSHKRYKALSTCSSHIIVVTFYYGTIMIQYFRPHSRSSPDIDRSISLIYTAVTPMLNPIIYSVRNKDVKETIRKILHY